MMTPADTTLFTSKDRVVCFGNRLHGDDAFGCHVHDALQAAALPEGTTVHDAGTVGLGGVVFFEGCDRVIVVDAIGPSAFPGRLRILNVEDALSVDSSLTTHAQGLGYLLRALPIAIPSPPSITIVGVDVAVVDTFKEELSVQTRRMILPARDLVIELLTTGERVCS